MPQVRGEKEVEWFAVFLKREKEHESTGTHIHLLKRNEGTNLSLFQILISTDLFKFFCT